MGPRDISSASGIVREHLFLLMFGRGRGATSGLSVCFATALGNEERSQADPVPIALAGSQVWLEDGSELFLDTAKVVFSDMKDGLPVAEQRHRLIVAERDEAIELRCLMGQEHCESLPMLVLRHVPDLVGTCLRRIVDEREGALYCASHPSL